MDGRFAEKQKKRPRQQVELLPVHDEALVQCGQKKELVPTESFPRHCKQAVIAACVTVDDAGVAIGARLVRSKNLPLERIGQVNELRLIEFQISHKCHML